MRLYLSGPMTGKPDNNRTAFTKAAAHLRWLGHIVVSPSELDRKSAKSPTTWGAYLGRDIQILADSKLDGIVLLPGWEKSNGARLELFASMLLRLLVAEYDPDTADLLYIDDTMDRLRRSFG